MESRRLSTTKRAAIAYILGRVCSAQSYCHQRSPTQRSETSIKPGKSARKWLWHRAQPSEGSRQALLPPTDLLLAVPPAHPPGQVGETMTESFEHTVTVVVAVVHNRHSNVVILTTSNITEKIDVAFVDRADIKQYIGPPSAAAIFKIYLSCLEELMKVAFVFFPTDHL
jgi:hypothetical protein